MGARFLSLAAFAAQLHRGQAIRMIPALNVKCEMQATHT